MVRLVSISFTILKVMTVGEGEAVNWGMKDIPFFDQSVELMKEMPQPFYSRLITLTNHHPFDLDEEDKLIPEYTSNSNTLNKYFQTVRYMDEAIKVLFEDLKASGLYDNSIIVMYGDHYGISENHNKAMGMYLDKEITPFDNAKLQRVPLYIHIPGYGKGKTIDEVSGQIDLKPTILHLMGLETKDDMYLGSDIFSPDHEPFTIFRDGRFVTDKNVYTQEVCYDSETGEETDIAECEPFIERATTELNYSDMIINGDLLRFKEEQEQNHRNETVKVRMIRFCTELSVQPFFSLNTKGGGAVRKRMFIFCAAVLLVTGCTEKTNEIIEGPTAIERA